MALEKASRFYAALGILLCVTVVHAGTGIRLQKVGTDAAYFTHNGQPLLSFGGMSDWVFYLNEDAHDYRQWADWAAAHGMNHARAYPPLSYKMIEYVTAENEGAVANALFPYEETSPGSRQFDLTRFDAAYWTQFRNQLLYFQSKGIIVHLLMWNGWQLRAPDTTSGWKGEVNWPGHFFNPANNVNAGTDHLGGALGNRYRLYHAVSDNRTALLNAQKAYFRKLIDETYDLDNVYYDLVHEMAEHYTDWTKTKRWIEAIALDVRSHWATKTSKPIVLGMDSGGFDGFASWRAAPGEMPASGSPSEWLFSRSFFDILIYGKTHYVTNAREWRKRYNKPYVPQETWDDNDARYVHPNPAQRVNKRKSFWKLMMAKCQQMDMYVGTGYCIVNFDPAGLCPSEDDALKLRAFWNSLTDYPNLWFDGSVAAGPGSHKFVLSSGDEAVAYCSSATGVENRNYSATTLDLRSLALADGSYTVDIWKPASGKVSTTSASVSGGATQIALSSFTDDIAAHIHSRTSQGGPIRIEAENMTLATYRVENQWAGLNASGDKIISLKGGSALETGTASRSFPGTSGTYDIVVGAVDENDGVPHLELRIAGSLVAAWDMDRWNGGDEVVVRRTVAAGRTINAGATVQLTGTETASAHARVDYIEFIPGSAPQNIPPTVQAGSDQSITLPTDTVSLDGTVTDDGQPNPPGTVTTVWTKVGGPAATVTFGNKNAVDTTASFLVAGTYLLRLTADDSDRQASDDVRITVHADTTPPANPTGLSTRE